MEKAVIVTSFIGYGDLLYMTRLIRFLKRSHGYLEFWGLSTEPMLHNPDIDKIVKLDSTQVTIPNGFKHKYPITHMPNPSNNHIIDLWTHVACNFSLPYREKHLTLKWLDEDERKISQMMADNGLVSHRTDCPGNFVTVCPVITWPSRTLPLEFYRELVARIQAHGDKVVLVGKDVDRREISDNKKVIPDDLVQRENKSLYAAENFPGAVDFTNRLNLKELACLHSHAKIAVNSENGNMVISTTNDTCWNLYIPTLTAPEFRLPWRLGRQDYKTIVAANDEDYYPTLDYDIMIGLKTSVADLPVKIPSVEKVFRAYKIISPVRT